MAMWGGYVLRARIPQRPVFTTGDVQETYASMNAGVLPSALVLVCYLSADESTRCVGRRSLSIGHAESHMGTASNERNSANAKR